MLTLVSTTLCDTNAVNHLILGEDGIDRDRLLKLFLGPIDLLADGASVDLDLHDVSLLLALLHQLHLQSTKTRTLGPEIQFFQKIIYFSSRIEIV
jgi:hypothetical protein